MKMIHLAVAGAALLAPLASSPAAAANPNKYWHMRTECDRHLAEAHNADEFYHRVDECNRHLAEFRLHQRREAVEQWKHREEEWRARHREYRDRAYYNWRY